MAIAIDPNLMKIGDKVSCVIYGGTLPNIVTSTVVGFSRGDSLRDPVTAANSHVNIYPALPVGHDIEDDYRSYEYVVLRKPDTSIIEIGIPWIRPETLERLERKTVRVEISDFDENRLNELKEVLIIKGFIPNTTTFLTPVV